MLKQRARAATTGQAEDLGLPSLVGSQRAAWNDIVSFGFECQTCGKGFRLHVETYYG
jgi:hypothetical protein